MTSPQVDDLRALLVSPGDKVSVFAISATLSMLEVKMMGVQGCRPMNARSLVCTSAESGTSTRGP
jgi:hypothetical protein